MTFPRDLKIFRSAPDSPAAALGIEWCKEGERPAGYLDLPESDSRTRGAWEQMFRELTFVARGDEGEKIALWRHSPDVPLEHAPVVVLDPEGQLDCRAATFSDFLVSKVNDPEALRSWCAAHGIDTAGTPERVRAKVRLLPDPNDRASALQQGDSSPLPVRTEDPRTIEDLLGMAGRDPRVLRFLESVEREDNPLQIQCDRAGRVATIFIEPESVRVPLEIRGFTLGSPASTLASLGTPHKTAPGWSRWDAGDVALHVEFPTGHVSRITLMARSSLPPHLR